MKHFFVAKKKPGNHWWYGRSVRQLDSEWRTWLEHPWHGATWVWVFTVNPPLNDMISYPQMIKMYQEFVVVETSFQGRFCLKKSSSPKHWNLWADGRSQILSFTCEGKNPKLTSYIHVMFALKILWCFFLWFVSCWWVWPSQPWEDFRKTCHMEPEEDECGDAGVQTC